MPSNYFITIRCGRKECNMKLSLLGISITVFGLALIIVASGAGTTFGLLVSLFGVMVSFASCFIKSNSNV